MRKISNFSLWKQEVYGIPGKIEWHPLISFILASAYFYNLLQSVQIKFPALS